MDFGTVTLKPTPDADNEPLLAELQRKLRGHDTLPYSRDRVGFQTRPDFTPYPSIVTAPARESLFGFVGGLPTDTITYAAIVLMDEGESRGEVWVCRSATPWRQCDHYSGEKSNHGNDVRAQVESAYDFPPNTTRTVKQLDDFDDGDEDENDVDSWLGG